MNYEQATWFLAALIATGNLNVLIASSAHSEFSRWIALGIWLVCVVGIVASW